MQIFREKKTIFFCPESNYFVPKSAFFAKKLKQKRAMLQ